MLLSKRRGFSRFVFLLHQLRPESQFLRHNYRLFEPEMAAAAAAANVISSDLFQSKGFHFHPSAISASSSSELSGGFPFSGKYPISKRYCSGRTTSRSGCGCGCGGATSIGFAFTPIGCFDSDSHNRLPRHRSLHTNSSSRRSNGFEHHKAQFFRDLELEEIPPLQNVRGDTSKLAPNGREGAFQNGKPLGFPHHHLPRDKVVVAVDVDEVLGNFVSALNRFIADRYSLNRSVSEYHVYEFFKIWNCSRDEADIRVHEFFKTSYFKTGIHPIPGALEALHNLSRIYDLSVVTSRQNAIKDHTIKWIEKHYPGLFQEIHFGNHFALDGISRSKSEICRSLGAKVLIDDNPRYAIECAEVGIRVLLFDYENSYPWCKTGSINQHPLVTKVHNWEEVEQQLVSVVLQ